MDSKLVVEQMSGRWKVKHPDMKPLALQAARLAPAGVTYTWVPRNQNNYADRILNEALDGRRADPFPQTTGDPVVESEELSRRPGPRSSEACAAPRSLSSWSATARPTSPGSAGSAAVVGPTRS